ncbi:DEAD/DEAH box helicase [Bradyrhizobium diazoefficiens]|nr:DEAD/DEAH box helicase [Bradyrhizobium diazoefficiens]
MADALVSLADLDDPGSALYGSFLRANFDAVLAHCVVFWRDHPEYLQREGSASILREEGSGRIGWYFTVELVRTLGLCADCLRRGDDARLTQALLKMKALDGMAARTFSDDISLLISLLYAVARSYAAASIYGPVRRLAPAGHVRSRELAAYCRRQYSRGRGILWVSQQAGLQRLIAEDSFALCTPTGSGKTLIANLGIVKELLLRDHDGIVPLAIYLVPSRALAGEVEHKLRGELGAEFIVTGLYGGTDWGITDYWLAADQPTVLVATVEKAEALMRYLAPHLITRLKLLIIDEAHQVVPDDVDSARKDFANHSSRALRLESFVSRLLAQVPGLVRIALTAVAGGAAGPVARWVEGRENAQAVGIRYRSTRQIIGVLENARGRSSRLLLELLNDKRLRLQDRGDAVYMNLRIGPMPKLPARMYSSLYRFNELSVLWTALHLVDGERRILISIAQEPEQTMGWYVEAFALPTWTGFTQFEPPEGVLGGLYREAFDSCVDYCGANSYEAALLARGIATSHGQMPQRLRRLMTELIDRKICPITLATATLSEGVNLPFDIIFVTSLQRASFDADEEERIVRPLSTAEFRNLAGRAGRPGAAKGMEGMTFVALPTTIGATAPRLRGLQTRQMAGLRANYVKMRRNLRAEELGGETIDSPLGVLLEAIREKFEEIFGDDDNEAFLDWLEVTAPSDITEHAGRGVAGERPRLADSLDELDAVLLSAIEEVSRLDGAALEPTTLEQRLAEVWRSSFTAAAAAREEWLKSAFIQRGRGLVDKVYTDPAERSRLYQYGFSPHVGRRFEATAAAIRVQLLAASNYGSDDEADRLARFEAIGELLTDDRGFGFRIRNTQTDRDLLANWEEVLGWWMGAAEAAAPEPAALRSWQRFVSENLEFRLGVAIGAVVAQAWTQGADSPLAVPSLAEWQGTTELPWFGFWARELLRWGTLDPFVAFALAQGRAKTRQEAAALRTDFNAWLEREVDEIVSEDRIDPRHFLEWERSLPRRAVDHPAEAPEPARLTGTDGRNEQYAVLPVCIAGTVYWLDAAGYELARSNGELESFDESALSDDFILDAIRGEPVVLRAYRAAR